MHIGAKLGRMVTYFERLPSLKPNDPFSAFTVLMVTKLLRILSSGRDLRRQTLKSSPNFLQKRYKSSRLTYDKDPLSILGSFLNRSHVC